MDQSGKRALLLIDNLNDVLSSIRDPEPLHRLRAFLMKNSRVMIIGGATRYFDEITSVDQPFYDFFCYFELRPLTAEEMETCLLAQAKNRGDKEIAEILKDRQGTVRALHLLTGGNPRLVKTFYRLVAEGLRSDIRTDLERLMDDFTPYFKAIVDALPVQQQRILDAVALAWDPVEVWTLATSTRLPSNQVSAQLRSLVKAGLIREAAGEPKRKTYVLADRFSNIHYLMRHGRAARNRLDWFLALVRLVFPDRESADILARAAREAAECGPEGCHDARSVIHSALSRAESSEARRALMHATLREGWESGAWESLDKWFDAERAQADLPEIGILGFCQSMPAVVRKELGYKPQDARWWFRLANFLEEKRAWSVAEAAYSKAIELEPQWAPPWSFLGILLMQHLGRPADAETKYSRAIERDPKDPFPWNMLGNLLERLGRLSEAEVAYRKAIELNSKELYSWSCLGDLLANHLNRPTEAEAAYREAIKFDPKDSNHSWNRLGALFTYRLNRPTEVEAAFRKAIELDPKDSMAWSGLGVLLMSILRRFSDAEAAFRHAIDINPKSVLGWLSLGHLFESLGRSTEAEVPYRQALQLVLDGDPVDAFLWDRLACVLSTKDGARDEAKSCVKKAVLLNPNFGPARATFLRLCGNQAGDWRAVLPSLVAWCVSNSKADKVFDFTVEGFLRLARLTKPSEALALIDSLPDASPFQTVRDVFVAHGNREHLHSLAPERQSVVLALLDRLTAPADSKSETVPKPKRKIILKKK